MNEWDDKVGEPIAKISNRDAAIAVARSLGRDDAVTVLANAVSVGVQGELSVILPSNRLEHLSKGRGWARLGGGDAATWGVKTDGGYRVSRPGNWVVGGSDGFCRKKEETYKVTRVVIGDVFWCVAMNA